MKQIRTEIDIKSTPDKVWGILTDFEKHPDWNPFIKKISGNAGEGEKLDVFIEPPGRKGMSFQPTVKEVEVNKRLRWLGRVLLPGIFDGEHIFEITEVKEGSLKFVQRENFGGLLVPLLWRSIEEPTRNGFLAMNQALKLRVELSGNDEGIERG